MIKKNDKPGVYEINGRVIDIFGLTDEEFDQARKTMTREDFIEYAVCLDMATRKAWEDGLIEDCDEMGDFTDDELMKIFRELEEDIYDICTETSSVGKDLDSVAVWAVDPGPGNGCYKVKACDMFSKE